MYTVWLSKSAIQKIAIFKIHKTKLIKLEKKNPQQIHAEKTYQLKSGNQNIKYTQKSEK
jgi:hypothetical protein